MYFSMTILLTQNVSNCTRPYLRPKTNNHSFEKFSSLAGGKSCLKWQNSDFQSQFSTAKIIWIVLIFFFDWFKGHTFCYWHFWKLQFLNHWNQDSHNEKRQEGICSGFDWARLCSSLWFDFKSSSSYLHLWQGNCFFLFHIHFCIQKVWWNFLIWVSLILKQTFKLDFPSFCFSYEN